MAVRQEPLGRSVHVRTLGRRLSPRRWKASVSMGRLAVRASGSCNVKTARGTSEGLHVRERQPLQRGDGYSYTKGAALPPQA